MFSFIKSSVLLVVKFYVGLVSIYMGISLTLLGIVAIGILLQSLLK